MSKGRRLATLQQFPVCLYFDLTTLPLRTKVSRYCDTVALDNRAIVHCGHVENLQPHRRVGRPQDLLYFPSATSNSGSIGCAATLLSDRAASIWRPSTSAVLSPRCHFVRLFTLLLLHVVFSQKGGGQMDCDAGLSKEPLDRELDEIILEIDAPFGELPVEAIRAAQRHRDQIILRLVQLIERAVQDVEDGEKLETNGHFFALFLLVEFCAAESFNTIVRAVSLPDDLPSKLFGDGIHEALPLAVPAMANERLDEVLTLIRNRELNENVRWALQAGLVLLVADGLRSREEIVVHLREILIGAIENEDTETVLAAVHSLHDLYPEEAYNDIKRAYDLGLVDEFMIGLEDVDRQLARGKDDVLHRLQEKTTHIEDTIDMLRHWAAFQPRKEKPAVNSTPEERHPRPLPAPRQEPKPMIENIEPRVGRNQPCPCGSGKKYKKCCGSASQRKK